LHVPHDHSWAAKRRLAQPAGPLREMRALSAYMHLRGRPCGRGTRLSRRVRRARDRPAAAGGKRGSERGQLAGGDRRRSQVRFARRHVRMRHKPGGPPGSLQGCIRLHPPQASSCCGLQGVAGLAALHTCCSCAGPASSAAMRRNRRYAPSRCSRAYMRCAHASGFNGVRRSAHFAAPGCHSARTLFFLCDSVPDIEKQVRSTPLAGAARGFLAVCDGRRQRQRRQQLHPLAVSTARLRRSQRALRRAGRRRRQVRCQAHVHLRSAGGWSCAARASCRYTLRHITHATHHQGRAATPRYGPDHGHVVERRPDQEAAGSAAGRACSCRWPDALLRRRSQRCPARRALRSGRLPCYPQQNLVRRQVVSMQKLWHSVAGALRAASNMHRKLHAEHGRRRGARPAPPAASPSAAPRAARRSARAVRTSAAGALRAPPPAHAVASLVPDAPFAPLSETRATGSGPGSGQGSVSCRAQTSTCARPRTASSQPSMCWHGRFPLSMMPSVDAVKPSALGDAMRDVRRVPQPYGVLRSAAGRRLRPAGRAASWQPSLTDTEKVVSSQAPCRALIDLGQSLQSRRGGINQHMRSAAACQKGSRKIAGRITQHHHPLGHVRQNLAGKRWVACLNLQWGRIRL